MSSCRATNANTTDACAQAIRSLLTPAAGGASLDCPHCGDVAIESSTGLFSDGDGGACVSCGFPGHVSCDTETEAYWQASDADDARCKLALCSDCTAAGGGDRG